MLVLHDADWSAVVPTQLCRDSLLLRAGHEPGGGDLSRRLPVPAGDHGPLSAASEPQLPHVRQARAAAHESGPAIPHLPLHILLSLIQAWQGFDVLV